MKTFNSILDRIKSVWKILKPKLDLLFFHLISASWFFKLRNKKVIKVEVFYAYMSIATYFVAYGAVRDNINGVDYSTQYHILSSMFVLGWLLRVSTFFGYKSSKAVRDHFWRTQLINFLDPNYFMTFKFYKQNEERLRVLKAMWYSKYGVTVYWTKDNVPYWQKIQVALLLGFGCLGLISGYLF